MRKTRFFYEYQFLLAILLGWLILGDCAMARQSEVKKAVLQKRSNELVRQMRQNTDIRKQAQKKLQKDTSEREETEIRVALTDSDFQNIFHDSVTVILNGKETFYDAEELRRKDEIVSISDQGEGILVPSIQRQGGTPAYRGRIEIHPQKDGLLLINILPLEEYLKAVVPSEMPSSYEMEALKAQAVCARTYAFKQMQGSRLLEYGADVDDSVNYQVYQNVAPQKSTTRAVEETKGRILCQNGQPIEAYYFSTSAGVTSTDEIWGVSKASAWLKSVSCEFDSEEPWSAWEVKIPRTAIRQKAHTLLSLTGELKGISVLRKSQSGAVTELSVTTESGTETLSGEYEIRKFLSPEGCLITEKDGSTTKGGALLPSAYFEISGQDAKEILLKGGGYGHGVGMSQSAANEMAKEGYTYEEILEYFFREIEFGDIQGK
ncbi:MAG: SpoIID/LytB domain-containing protein [Eubacteriales bacterium]|nr:SpoIID/LytB domain-containing protein [Eubacteriales bacterium]